MKKKERRRLREVDRKYGLPKGTTERLKETMETISRRNIHHTGDKK